MVGLHFDSSSRVGPSFQVVVPVYDIGAFPCLVHYDLSIELPMVGPGASRLVMVVYHQLGLCALRHAKTRQKQRLCITK